MKNSIITMMLALVAMTGQAQTKTATVIGYSPALKDGTLVFAGTGSTSTVVDTVQAGRFAYSWTVRLHPARCGVHREFSLFSWRRLHSIPYTNLLASWCDCESDGQ